MLLFTMGESSLVRRSACARCGLVFSAAGRFVSWTIVRSLLGVVREIHRETAIQIIHHRDAFRS
jgi:hypothetical protein